MPDTGQLASCAFTTSGLSLSLTSIDMGEQTREMLDGSVLATTVRKRKYVTDLSDGGKVKFTFLWVPTAAAPSVVAAAETVTITLPKENSGSSAAATYAGTAAIIRIKYPELKLGALNVGECEFEWDGATGPTYTVEA